MDKSVILFRADASPAIGTGHVMRCLSLAQAVQDTNGKAVFLMTDDAPSVEERLKSEGFEILHTSATPGSEEDAKECAQVASEQGASWIVVDGYQFDAAYQRTLKDAGVQLLFIDDYGHCGHYCADFVLNQNISANEEMYASREDSTRLLLGTKYTALRREFNAFMDFQRKIPEVARKILVTLGGADLEDVTGKVIESLRTFGDQEVKVVVGGENPHLDTLKSSAEGGSVELIVNATNMSELMTWADIAISAGGTTCYELSFMGLPTVTIVLADNQRAITEGLEKAGVTLNLGWHADVSSADITHSIHQLIPDEQKRSAMSEAGKELIDGHGASSVWKEVFGK